MQFAKCWKNITGRTDPFGEPMYLFSKEKWHLILKWCTFPTKRALFIKSTIKSTLKRTIREWEEGEEGAGSIIPLGTSHLAVSYFGVPVGIGCEHSPEGGDARLALEGRVLGQRAVQVTLDLLRCHAALAHGCLHQMHVIPRVRGKIRLGVWRQQEGRRRKMGVDKDDAKPKCCGNYCSKGYKQDGFHQGLWISRPKSQSPSRTRLEN